MRGECASVSPFDAVMRLYMAHLCRYGAITLCNMRTPTQRAVKNDQSISNERQLTFCVGRLTTSLA